MVQRAYTGSQFLQRKDSASFLSHSADPLVPHWDCLLCACWSSRDLPGRIWETQQWCSKWANVRGICSVLVVHLPMTIIDLKFVKMFRIHQGVLCKTISAKICAIAKHVTDEFCIYQLSSNDSTNQSVSIIDIILVNWPSIWLRCANCHPVSDFRWDKTCQIWQQRYPLGRPERGGGLWLAG